MKEQFRNKPGLGELGGRSTGHIAPQNQRLIPALEFWY